MHHDFCCTAYTQRQLTLCVVRATTLCRCCRVGCQVTGMGIRSIALNLVNCEFEERTGPWLDQRALFRAPNVSNVCKRTCDDIDAVWSQVAQLWKCFELQRWLQILNSFLKTVSAPIWQAMYLVLNCEKCVTCWVTNRSDLNIVVFNRASIHLQAVLPTLEVSITCVPITFWILHTRTLPFTVSQSFSVLSKSTHRNTDPAPTKLSHLRLRSVLAYIQNENNHYHSLSSTSVRQREHKPQPLPRGADENDTLWYIRDMFCLFNSLSLRNMQQAKSKHF